MTRLTSLRAYREIKHYGLLSRLRWIVYRALFKHGPLTRNELDAMLRSENAINASYSRRLVELERMGVIFRAEVRPCRFTGRDCEAWDVTDKLPTKYTKPLTKAERYRGIVLAEISRHEAAGRSSTARRLRHEVKEIDRT